MNSPHKGQWRRVLMFSLICAWINGWVNNLEAGDLRHHRAHYDVTVMIGKNQGLLKTLLEVFVSVMWTQASGISLGDSEMQFNTLWPTHNCRYLVDNIFKSILLNENAWISLKMWLKWVPKVRISNIPALVQIMAWRRQARSHYVNQWWLVYWRIYASLGLNDLT